MTTEFSVRGAAHSDEAPERGVVHATIAFRGAAAAPIFEQLVASLERVTASIQPIAGEVAAVSEWSTQAVRTWAERPWHERGKQLPLVHHASVGVRVEFRDFTVLSRWLSEHVEGTEGFAVGGVEWTLTEGHRRSVERRVRAQAVTEAATRAQEYADALGLGAVRPVAIADVGMLSDSMAGAPTMRAMKFADAAESMPELGLEPADIRVQAEVDARFVAD